MARNISTRGPMWTHAPAALVAIVGCTYIALGLSADDLAGPAETVLPGGAALIQAAILFWRNSVPRTALALCVGLDAVVIVATGGEIGSGALGVAVATYTLARITSTRLSLPWIATAAATTAVASTVSLTLNPEYSVFVAVGASVLRVLIQNVLPAVLADAATTRSQLLHAYRERADAAERDREAAVEGALREERTALARELHDIAAHHVTGMVVSVQAAGALVRGNDPTAAVPYLSTAVAEARSTLEQLRVTVGLLRDHDADTDALALDGVPELVARVRKRGMSVEFHSDTEDLGLGPIERATVYRMIQESLTNAAQHAAGAPCTVRIAADPHRKTVTVTVTNDSPAVTRTALRAETSGLGLIGMHERAHLIGATLDTAAMPDGGWRNRLVITPGQPS